LGDPSTRDTRIEGPASKDFGERGVQWGKGAMIPVSNDDTLDGLHGRNFGDKVGGNDSKVRDGRGERQCVSIQV
jgi:hypothetical protein